MKTTFGCIFTHTHTSFCASWMQHKDCPICGTVVLMMCFRKLLPRSLGGLWSMSARCHDEASPGHWRRSRMWKEGCKIQALLIGSIHDMESTTLLNDNLVHVKQVFTRSMWLEKVKAKDKCTCWLLSLLPPFLSQFHLLYKIVGGLKKILRLKERKVSFR